MTELASCPICKGPVKAITGYYYEGIYIDPAIICIDRRCGLKLQPNRYPWVLEDLIELWNSSFEKQAD